MQKVTLNNGVEMPVIGFGTFLAKPDEVGQSIRWAIEAGYRHIDCALGYDNEKEIGVALNQIFEDKVVKREELFITSKLHAFNLHPDEVEKDIKETLKLLQIDYLDLYLIHHPISVEWSKDKIVPRRLHGVGMQDIWRKMEYVLSQGLTRSIGVSNFNAQLLNDVLNYAKIPPVLNQIERHPYFPQNELVAFCKANHLYVTAYGSLGSRTFKEQENITDIPDLIDSPVLKDIANNYGKTVPQILLRWSIDNDVICLPKSVHKDTIKENLSIFDFELSKADMDKIAQLSKVNKRTYEQEWVGFAMFC